MQEIGDGGIIADNPGPEVFNNWRMWQDSQNHEEWIVQEFPLFSDAQITGELADIPGPYQLLNTVPMSMGTKLAPTIVLRIAQPQGLNHIPSMQKTDDSRYHGGTIIDEIAALLALQMGVRFRAGKSTRMFFPGGDPRGNPSAFEMVPDLVTPKYLLRPVVPRARGEHALNKDGPLFRILELEPVDASALIKASRTFQDALWICESQPSLSWLFLVSAIETAADHWCQAREKPIEVFSSLKTKLTQRLREAGGEELLSEIAEEFAPIMGSTKKFVDFIMNFLPDPPISRPAAWAQFEWTDLNMRRALKTIYKHRSKSLHGGTPFPMPMCDPPMKVELEFAEKPTCSAASTRSGTWVADDLPILLNTFEYITRNALITWWRSMLKKAEGSSE